MKIKFKVTRSIQIEPNELERKIDDYLNANSYRVTQRGFGFIIFVDDEFSDRKRLRSDVHTRIDEGKLEFHDSGKVVVVKLIYLTPVSCPFFLMMLFTAAGIYINSFMPMFFSAAFLLPVLYRIHYIDKHVFNEILNS